MAQAGARELTRTNARAAPVRRKKRRRRGKRTIHIILLLIFLVAAGITLSLTVLFKIEDVTVVGCDKYTPDEIAAASGVEKGDNLLRVQQEEIEQNILEHFPYVQSVAIRRKFPPVLELQITQSTPDAAIQQQNGAGYILITQEGKVLERDTLLIEEEIPIVLGISAGNVQPGEYLDEDNTEALGMLERLNDAIEETGFSNVTNVDLTNLHNMRIAYEGRIDLLLGSEADLVYKLEFVDAVLNLLEEDARGVLNAADAALNKKIIFTPENTGESTATYEDSGDGEEHEVLESDDSEGQEDAEVGGTGGPTDLETDEFID